VIADENPVETESLLDSGRPVKVRRGFLFYSILIFLMAFSLRLVPALWAFHPSPDAVEYLAAAQSLRRGEGYRLKIKAFFPPGLEGLEKGRQIEHPAEWERSPLLPLLLVPFVNESDTGRPWVQLIPAFFAALAAVLGAFLTFRLSRLRDLDCSVSWGAALIAALMIGTYPPLFWASVRILTEPLELFLILGSLLACVGLGEDIKERPRRFPALAGVLAGLLIWTRPDGALAGFLILLALIVVHGLRDGLRFLGAWLLLGMLWWGGNFVRSGSLVPGQGFLFQVMSTHEVQWGYTGVYSALDGGQMVIGMGSNLRRYLVTILEPRNASFFTPLILWALFRSQSLKSWPRLLGLLGVGLLLFRAGIWSTQDAYRFPMVSACLFFVLGSVQLGSLLPPGSPKKQRSWLLFALLLILVGPGLRVIKRQRKESRPGSSWSHNGLVALKQSQRRGPDEVYCGTNPWALYCATGQPALLLPNALRKKALLGFLRTFEVDHVFLTPTLQHPGIAEPIFYKDWLLDEGWTLDELGDSWILSRN
jgi:hypothetical protein